MTVYNMYIFDRNGTCLYYTEWHRRKHSGMSKEEEYKLMYGMLFSLKSFVSRMSPTDQKEEGFMSFATNEYKLHFYETPSGLKFVLNTDLSGGNMKDVLHQIYSELFVEYVVKCPMCPLGESVTSELFKSKLDDFVQALPVFGSKVS